MNGIFATPSWLDEGLSGTARPSAAQADLRENSPAEVLAGDLCVVSSFDRSQRVGRLFLVTEVAESWCTGMMVGIETELATEVDAILPREVSGLFYETAVHTRFHGPIWVVQVQRRVGAVEAEVLAEVERLAWSDEADVSLEVGQPLQPDGIDPRFPALKALSTELDELTGHCRRRRHDLATAVLDPALADLDVLKAVLAEPGWEQRIGTALSSNDFRDRLLAALPQLTRDERRAAMPFIERATVGAAIPSARMTREAVSSHRDSAALARSVGANVDGAAVATVFSHRACWTDRAKESARVSFGSGELILLFAAVSSIPLREAA